jgi:hypothetical protein
MLGWPRAKKGTWRLRSKAALIETLAAKQSTGTVETGVSTQYGVYMTRFDTEIPQLPAKKDPASPRQKKATPGGAALLSQAE